MSNLRPDAREELGYFDLPHHTQQPLPLDGALDIDTSDTSPGSTSDSDTTRSPSTAATSLCASPEQSAVLPAPSSGTEIQSVVTMAERDDTLWPTADSHDSTHLAMRHIVPNEQTYRELETNARAAIRRGLDASTVASKASEVCRIGDPKATHCVSCALAYSLGYPLATTQYGGMPQRISDWKDELTAEKLAARDSEAETA
ncbi:uncharacterized protein MKK02DRAFT_44697 [Dioszegia hungarica]|uniref:Uncharacterized protein n=1 Tax=Dioszegia hungarica TaxID=4972 RepID=A0AA38LVV3_9TREE|nr:uncharacterized protein MKK02DRAFT_44697 [Dioszegia hungarica]KAI9635999.1 hypothetical protein MKK02DRAFT_44697 [Dioszegia hungarica]